MKKLRIILIAVIILCIVFFCEESSGSNKSILISYKVKWSNLDCRHQLYYTEKFLFFILHPYMEQKTNEYYDKPRQLTNFEITDIEIVGYDNFITVEVLSFTGAHNPPYGREVFKFQIGYKTDDENDCQIKLIEYKHEDE